MSDMECESPPILPPVEGKQNENGQNGDGSSPHLQTPEFEKINLPVISESSAMLDDIPYPTEIGSEDQDIPLPPDFSKYSPSQAMAAEDENEGTASPAQSSENTSAAPSPNIGERNKPKMPVLGMAQAKKRLAAFSQLKQRERDQSTKKSSSIKGVTVFQSSKSKSSPHENLAIGQIKQEEEKMKEVMALNSILSEKLKQVSEISTSIPKPPPVTAVVTPTILKPDAFSRSLDKVPPLVIPSLLIVKIPNPNSEDNGELNIKSLLGLPTKAVRDSRNSSSSRSRSRSHSKSESPSYSRKSRNRRGRSKERPRSRDGSKSREKRPDRRSRSRSPDKSSKQVQESGSRDRGRRSRSKERERKRSVSRERRSHSRDRDRRSRRSRSKEKSRGKKDKRRSPDKSSKSHRSRSKSPKKKDKKRSKSRSKSPSGKKKDKNKSRRSVSRDRESGDRRREREQQEKERKQAEAMEKEKREREKKEAQRERERQEQIKRELDRVRRTRMPINWEDYNKFEFTVDNVRRLWPQLKGSDRRGRSRSRSSDDDDGDTGAGGNEILQPTPLTKTLHRPIKSPPSSILIQLKNGDVWDYPDDFIKKTTVLPSLTFGINPLSFAGYYKSREQITKEETCTDVMNVMKQIMLPTDKGKSSENQIEITQKGQQQWFSTMTTFCPPDGSKGVLISHLYSDDMEDSPSESVGATSQPTVKPVEEKKAESSAHSDTKSKSSEETDPEQDSLDSAPSPLLKKRYEHEEQTWKISAMEKDKQRRVRDSSAYSTEDETERGSRPQSSKPASARRSIDIKNDRPKVDQPEDRSRQKEKRQKNIPSDDDYPEDMDVDFQLEKEPASKSQKTDDRVRVPPTASSRVKSPELSPVKKDQDTAKLKEEKKSKEKDKKEKKQKKKKRHHHKKKKSRDDSSHKDDTSSDEEKETVKPKKGKDKVKSSHRKGEEEMSKHKKSKEKRSRGTDSSDSSEDESDDSSKRTVKRKRAKMEVERVEMKPSFHKEKEVDKEKKSSHKEKEVEKEKKSSHKEMEKRGKQDASPKRERVDSDRSNSSVERKPIKSKEKSDKKSKDVKKSKHRKKHSKSSRAGDVSLSASSDADGKSSSRSSSSSSDDDSGSEKKRKSSKKKSDKDDKEKKKDDSSKKDKDDEGGSGRRGGGAGGSSSHGRDNKSQSGKDRDRHHDHEHKKDRDRYRDRDRSRHHSGGRKRNCDFGNYDKIDEIAELALLDEQEGDPEMLVASFLEKIEIPKPHVKKMNDTRSSSALLSELDDDLLLKSILEERDVNIVDILLKHSPSPHHNTTPSQSVQTSVKGGIVSNPITSSWSDDSQDETISVPSISAVPSSGYGTEKLAESSEDSSSSGTGTSSSSSSSSSGSSSSSSGSSSDSSSNGSSSSSSDSEEETESTAKQLTEIQPLGMTSSVPGKLYDPFRESSESENDERKAIKNDAIVKDQQKGAPKIHEDLSVESVILSTTKPDENIGQQVADKTAAVKPLPIPTLLSSDNFSFPSFSEENSVCKDPQLPNTETETASVVTTDLVRELDHGHSKNTKVIHRSHERQPRTHSHSSSRSRSSSRERRDHYESKHRHRRRSGSSDRRRRHEEGGRRRRRSQSPGAHYRSRHRDDRRSRDPRDREYDRHRRRISRSRSRSRSRSLSPRDGDGRHHHGRGWREAPRERRFSGGRHREERGRREFHDMPPEFLSPREDCISRRRKEFEDILNKEYALPGEVVESPPLQLNIADSTISDSELAMGGQMVMASGGTAVEIFGGISKEALYEHNQHMHANSQSMYFYPPHPNQSHTGEEMSLSSREFSSDHVHGQFLPEVGSGNLEYGSSSPKRLSLDERLEKEMGIKLMEEEPSAKSQPKPPVLGTFQPLQGAAPGKVPTPWIQGQQKHSQVMQVGNVIQVVPAGLQENVTVRAQDLSRSRKKSRLEQINAKEFGKDITAKRTVTIKVPVVPFKVPMLPPAPDVPEAVKSAEPKRKQKKKRKRTDRSTKVAEANIDENEAKRSKSELEADNQDSGIKEEQDTSISKEEIASLEKTERELSLEPVSDVKEVVRDEHEDMKEADEGEQGAVGDEDSSKDKDGDEIAEAMKENAVDAVIPNKEPTLALPTRGILVSAGFRERTLERLQFKTRGVTFTDGIKAGCGTSSSGGEEMGSPPPPSQESVQKVKVKRKKKVKVKPRKVKNADDSTERPPSPPPVPSVPYPYCPPGILYQVNLPYAMVYAQAISEKGFDIVFQPSDQMPIIGDQPCEAVEIVAVEPKSQNQENYLQTTETPPQTHQSRHISNPISSYISSNFPPSSPHPIQAHIPHLRLPSKWNSVGHFSKKPSGPAEGSRIPTIIRQSTVSERLPDLPYDNEFLDHPHDHHHDHHSMDYNMPIPPYNELHNNSSPVLPPHLQISTPDDVVTPDNNKIIPIIGLGTSSPALSRHKVHHHHHHHHHHHFQPVNKNNIVEVPTVDFTDQRPLTPSSDTVEISNVAGEIPELM